MQVGTHRGPEEGTGFLRAGVTDDYPKWMLEIELGPLEEAQYS